MRELVKIENPAQGIKSAMLCERCNELKFRPLLARDKKSGYYILHHNRQSYSRSLAKQCALCTLVSSQLGEIELRDDVCEDLEAFMVLKRRWPTAGTGAASANPFPVNVHSRLGFGTLTVMDGIDALPIQYRTLDHEHKTSHCGRKRKRDQVETPDSSELPYSQYNNRSEESISREMQSQHTGSDENMVLARHWIRDCLKSHDMCASGSSHRHAAFLPARLIDTQDPKRPFLHETIDARGIEYIVLSYVWGHGEMFKSTAANFKDHQHCIPLQSVPRTVTHAFQVTRELGYRYIWVDALCIMQDDDDDLERELANMGEIYQHAVFTICAEGAPGARAGLFQKRHPYLYHPCTVGVKMMTDKGVISEQLTLGTIVTGPNYLKDRGWVLQEEILSSRCLSFGKQMSWKCTVSEASETAPAPRPRKTALSHGRATCEDKLRLWLYAPAQMRETPREQWFRWNQYDAWYSVVEQYSSKNLTKSTDQLRALSGLADLFQKAHHSTYAAGLWREDLQLGLAWYVASNDSRPVREVGIQKPSWSWASVGMVRLKFRSRRAYSTHIVSDGAEILDVSCTLRNQLNPCGCVADGILKLRTRVKKLRLHWSTEYIIDRTEFSYGSYSGTETTTMAEREHPRFPALVSGLESAQVIGEAALDRPIHTRAGARLGYTDPLRISNPRVFKDDIQVWCALLHIEKDSDTLRITALILDREPESTTYRRLGLLFLDERRVGDMSLSDWHSDAIDVL
ncbi:HET-domain-containing protein [Xylariaceae sp. AK1471]|nr:HET-domain-containing protein [Xylariaceae sp. AK1471]